MSGCPMGSSSYIRCMEDATPDEPLVVVVDHEDTRRSRMATSVRHAGARPIVVDTPLEAIALVESGDWQVAAVAVAEHLTQTEGSELAEYLAEMHPELALAVIGGRAPTADAVVLPADGSDATEPIRILVMTARP